MHKYITSLVILLVLIPTFIVGQGNVDFEKLSYDRGVTQSVVYGIAQDKNGYIWMATEDGVVKYNSNFSTTYNKHKGLPKDIGNRINKLFITKSGEIYLGTNTGVCAYSEVLDKFVKIDADAELRPSLVRTFTEDVNGRIWIGAFNGLWFLKDQNTKFEQIKNIGSLGELRIQSIESGPKNKLVLGTEDGLVVYDCNKETFLKVPYSEGRIKIYSIARNKSDYLLGTLSSGLLKVDSRFRKIEKIQFSSEYLEKNTIRSILKEKGGNIYIGTDGNGIFYLNNDYKVINQFSHDVDDNNSLSSNGVYDILIDREDIIWVATYGGGVNYLDKTKAVFEKVKHVLNSKNSLENSFTRAIEVDKYGRIWFGTKKGVSIWDRKINKWTHVKGIDGIVLAIELGQQDIWVGTFNRGVYKVNPKTLKVTKFTLPLKKVYSILKDSKNNIWFGGIEEDLHKLSTDNKLIKYPIRDIRSLSEYDGNILIAGRYGVSSLNFESDQLKEYAALRKAQEKLNFNTVSAVSVLSKNKFLIATSGAGLLFYDHKKDEMKSINMSSGLPSDIIQGLISASKEEIWMSTTKGLVQLKISESDTIIHVFDKNDGLASTEYNYGSYKKINENLFAFGGVDGVTLFDPAKIKMHNAKPNIVFQEFSVFNKLIQPEDEILSGHINTVKNISLKYRENSITFKYVGILHNSSDKVKYSWKLDGFSDKWTTPSESNYSNFTNLNYGDYIFRVKASNRFGEWGEERSIKITIQRPWWASKTAYFLYVLGVLIIFVLTIYFTKILLNKKNADEQIEFFNNLTHEIRTPLTILLSSLDSMPKIKEEESETQVRKTITRLNALFDQMLNFKKATASSRNLKNVSKIDLENHVKELIGNFKPLIEEQEISIKLNNQWDDVVFYFNKEILNKILFNLISNAIKYTRKGGGITVNLIETKKKELRIEVVDTGIGIPKDQQKFILKRFYRARNVVNSQKPGTGLGLMMVKSLVDKSHGTINFTSKENVGTTFEVVIPNNVKYYKNSVVLKSNFQQEFEIHEHAEISEFSDRKVLIVEDNDELRSLLTKSLGTYFQVYEASNGKQGLELAEQIFPDIILTDLIMPEMDGMQMAKKLFDDISLNHIPVFMMTVINDSKLKNRKYRKRNFRIYRKTS